MKIICKPTPKVELKKYDTETIEIIKKPDGSIPLGHYKGKLLFSVEEAEILDRADEVEVINTTGGKIEFNLVKLLAIYIQYGFKTLRVYEGELIMIDPEDECTPYEGVIEPKPIYVLAAYYTLSQDWEKLKFLLKQLDVWYVFFTDLNSPISISVKYLLKRVVKEINEKGDWVPDIKVW